MSWQEPQEAARSVCANASGIEHCKIRLYDTHSTSIPSNATMLSAKNCKGDDDSGKRDVLFEFEIANDLIFHQLALILSAIFMCIAVLISCWLILDHALHYLRPYEQKQCAITFLADYTTANRASIIRILFMIPVYAIVSFLSLLFYTEVVYLELIRTCYEAYVIASFFTLMCHYIAPNLHEQKEYFRNVKPQPWVFPLNKVKTPRSGLTWFNIIYACVFQFCITRPLFTLIAGYVFSPSRNVKSPHLTSYSVLQYDRRYCQQSSSPLDAHLWIVLLQGACAIIAMYCLVQFYEQLKPDLAPHKTFLKFLCIKLATFVGFWQVWLLSLLSASKGPFKHTKYIATVDIHVAVPCLLVSVEMMLYACVFHWAFPWRPYDLDKQLRGEARLEEYAAGPHTALLEALSPWDYWKSGSRGVWWLVHGARHRMEDASYLAEKEEDEGDEDEGNEDEDSKTLKASRIARTNALSDPGPSLGTESGIESERLRQRRTVG